MHAYQTEHPPVLWIALQQIVIPASPLLAHGEQRLAVAVAPAQTNNTVRNHQHRNSEKYNAVPLKRDRPDGLTSPALHACGKSRVLLAQAAVTAAKNSTCAYRVRNSVANYGQLLMLCDQNTREKAWRSRKPGLRAHAHSLATYPYKNSATIIPLPDLVRVLARIVEAAHPSAFDLPGTHSKKFQPKQTTNTVSEAYN